MFGYMTLNNDAWNLIEMLRKDVEDCDQYNEFLLDLELECV